VLDNATGPDAIAGLLPEGTGGRVLITTRVHADWRRLRAQPLALDVWEREVWEREESTEFLRERTGEQDDSLLDAVAEAIGDLPLALEQAAAYTNTKAITLSGYLERLRDRAPQLFSAGRPAGYEHTVSTVWQLAFEQITQHPITNDLLGVGAYLAPERIPRELLEAAVEHGAIPDISQQAADDAIELLLAYALLTPATEQTFDMHRLIGQLTRDRGDAAAQARAATAAAAVLEALWPLRSWEHEQWPACQRLLAHALAATEHSQRLSAAPEQTASLLGRAGQYEAARAQLRSARGLMKRALAIREAIYGPDHPEVGITLTSLGGVEHHLGELEQARVTLERALAIDEAVYGSEHPQVGSALRCVGNVQQQLGQLADAHGTLQRALRIFEAVYGLEHSLVAITLSGLGVVEEQRGSWSRHAVRCSGRWRSRRRSMGPSTQRWRSRSPVWATCSSSVASLSRRASRCSGRWQSMKRSLGPSTRRSRARSPSWASCSSSLGSSKTHTPDCNARWRSSSASSDPTTHPRCKRDQSSRTRFHQPARSPE
jgi:hypothetical protein